MKKSLVALAVLAASGAAMAQSTVTLYGLVDTYLASVNTDNGLPNGSLTQTVLNSGAVNGSRWGLKGSEDLGGGLKANFQLESGFANDTGASGQGGLLFGRHAWVGFSGGFGAVKFGRIPTAYDDIATSGTAVFASALSPTQNIHRTELNYTVRTNNTIKYETANYSGFSAALGYALGENKTATVGAGSTTSLNLAYAGGPLSVALGYQTEKANGNAVDVNFTRLNGSYAFGAATVKAGWGKAGNVGAVNGADATEYTIGLDYKTSPALTLSAGYARSSDNITAGDFTRSGFGLGAAYTLSKRTFLYGGYEADTTTKTGVADTKHSVLAVGVQHRF